jgi:WD40 repeat protein
VFQKFLVSGGVHGELRVWEIRSRELVVHLKEHTARVNSVAIFDDNLHVLSCSRDRSFLCWDLQQEKRVSSHVQRMGGLNTMALSRDQQTIVTAGQEKRIT